MQSHEGSCQPNVPHFFLPTSAAAGYSPISHDWGLHPTCACSRKQQARLLQQPPVRRDRPAARSTSIGTESLCAVGTSTAKVWSGFWRHAGEASLASHPTENYLQTLSPRLQVPTRWGSGIPLRDEYAFVWHPASTPSSFGRAWKSPHTPNSNKDLRYPLLFGLWAVLVEFTPGWLEKHWTDFGGLQIALEDSSCPPILWTLTLSGTSTSTLAMDFIYNGALYKWSIELNWIQGPHFLSKDPIFCLKTELCNPMTPLFVQRPHFWPKDPTLCSWISRICPWMTNAFSSLLARSKLQNQIQARELYTPYYIHRSYNSNLGQSLCRHRRLQVRMFHQQNMWEEDQQWSEHWLPGGDRMQIHSTTISQEQH